MIQSYRELEIWQRAETLGHRVFTLTFPQYYFLSWSRRLRYAALAVSTALAVGCATTTPKDFLRQLRTARRWAERVKRLLLRASTRELVNAHDYQQLAAGYDDLQSMTDVLSRSMRQTPRLSVVRVVVAGAVSVGIFFGATYAADLRQTAIRSSAAGETSRVTTKSFTDAAAKKRVTGLAPGGPMRSRPHFLSRWNSRCFHVRCTPSSSTTGKAVASRARSSAATNSFS